MAPAVWGEGAPEIEFLLRPVAWLPAQTTISGPLASLRKNWHARLRRRVERRVLPGGAGSRPRHRLPVEALTAHWEGMLTARRCLVVRQGPEAVMRARTMHPGLPGRCDVPVHQDSSVTERFGDYFFLEDGLASTGGIPIAGNARESRWFAPGTPLRTSRQGVPVTLDFLQTCRSASVSEPLHQWRLPDRRPRVRPCFRLFRVAIGTSRAH